MGMAQAPTVTIDLVKLEEALRAAGATDEEVLQVTNEILNVIRKSRKYQDRGRVYREVNKALSPIYRAIKYTRGLSGDDAWREWYRIQREALAALTGI
jgi:hypothetical protein